MLFDITYGKSAAISCIGASRVIGAASSDANGTIYCRVLVYVIPTSIDTSVYRYTRWSYFHLSSDVTCYGEFRSQDCVGPSIFCILYLYYISIFTILVYLYYISIFTAYLIFVFRI